MENIFASLISQWGIFGVSLILSLYIIGEKAKEHFLSSKNINKEHKNITHDTDIILTQINSIRDDLKLSVKSVEYQMETMKDNFENKYNSLDNRLCDLDDKVNNQPNIIMNNLDIYNNKMVDMHNKKMLSQIKLGPILYKILGRYLDLIKCDHIVLGAFHNGTSTLSGIPYCKFDIISEKFHPNDFDTDFASMYKNVDILLHGKLPSIIMQNNYQHFYIDTPEKCDLDEIDDILYRRLLGRNIKQLSLHILKDVNDIPIGFIGCIKYNNDLINENELFKCVHEIENIYNNQLDKLKNI